ncbi:MAG: cytochrome c nitrite reductase small subunit [Azoarcus sp.]|jgi:cytochrome c nitrite reductase small subunit|nr:cytochrome c nitrite reductase small subunit [Azoarcus sp.]
MSERSSCGFFKGILNALPSKLIVPLFLLGGVAVGLGLYNVYVARVFSYLGDDPATCVNCHIMSVSYQSWSKSSHSKWTNCKDCHVPQHNKLAALLFEAQDGLHHAAVFLMKKEPAAPRPRPAATKVIQDNCVRCHTPLTTEFVKAGKATHDGILVKDGHQQEKACWDCHRHVPHGRNSGLASAPNALAPHPPSSVPDWLKNILQ